MLIRTAFRHAAYVSALATMAVGVTGIVGWVFDITLLKSVIPDIATLKVNTAVSFVLTGLSLGLQVEPGVPLRKGVAGVLALLATVLGALTALQYVLGVDLGIDQLLLAAPPGEIDTTSPGRMALPTSVGFVAAGTSLLLLDAKRKLSGAFSQVLAIGVLTLGFLTTAGDLLSVTTPSAFAGYTSMPFHTAIGFTALAMGLLASRPDRGLVVIVAKDNSAGSSARRLLPGIFFAPLALGWLRLKGEQAGWFGTDFGLSLMLTAITGFVAVLVVWNARRQDAVDTILERTLHDERFFVGLAEHLRSSPGSTDLLFQVSKYLGEHLGISRCYFVEIDVAGDRVSVRPDYNQDGHPSLAGTHRLSLFSPSAIAEAMAGRSVVSNDMRVESPEQYERSYRAIGIRACVSIPLARNGQWVSTLVVSSHAPRLWDERELALIRSVAERTWLWYEHLLAVETLRGREEEYRLAIEAAPTGMLKIDRDGNIVLVNDQLEKLFGYRRHELIGTAVEMLVPERFRGGHPQYRGVFFRDPSTRPMGGGRELYGLHKDGSEIPVEIGLSPVKTPDGDFVLASVADVSERKRAEREKEAFVEQLRSVNAELEQRVQVRTSELTGLLKEREILMQEVHHRVKNNLQVISSLINMQMRQIRDPFARSAFDECKGRVEAIALIHEKLYQFKDYANVPFSEYTRSLVANIFHATGVSQDAVSLRVEIEAVSLPVDKAIPCGLILNELMTNALKHAFPAERRGVVRVELRRLGTMMFLAVEDDGVGIPANFDPVTTKSLGMQLVTTLVEQLDGRMELVRTAGTAFRITFPLEIQS